MKEIWKDVVGYEGYYQVSNLGRVRSLISNKILSQYQGNHGYMCLRLGKCDHVSKKLVLVHRLVAQAFIPNPNNLPQVGHKDESRTKNYADNLEWVLSVDNNNATKHKERISKGRSGTTLSSPPRYMQVECGEVLYPSLRSFCRYNNLNLPTVWRWLNNITKMPNEWKERGLRYVE